MREVEIKLKALPQDLPKIKQALLVMAGNAEERGTKLVSTYFDTPDLSLLRQEKVLRVRRDGSDFIQTVKAGNGNGTDLLTRGEWEDPVAGEAIDLTAPNTSRHLASVAGEQLLPLFTTVVDRTVITWAADGATTIEAALDSGTIRAIGNAAAEPVCEIELELKRGEPAALYDMALRLLDTAPLRFSTVAKSERGYRLATGGGLAPEGEARHAGPIRLSPDMTAEAAFQAIGRNSLIQILGNEEAVLAKDSEGIHQMRVGLRRQRSALKTFRSLLPVEDYRWASRELKWLADALGDARNWDVFEQSLLRPVLEAHPGQAALKRLAKVCRRRRQEEFEKAREVVQSPRYTAALLRLARWFDTCGWRGRGASEASPQLLSPVTAVASGLIEARMGKVLKKSRRFASRDADERHELRIACKEIRYTMEFMGSLYAADKVDAFLGRLKPVLEILGHANDVAVVRGLLKAVKTPGHRPSNDRAGRLVVRWHKRSLAQQEGKLRKRVARLRRAAPFW